MRPGLIKIIDICTYGNISIAFIRELQSSGLIEIVEESEVEYLEEENLSQLEKFHTWHEDLEINVYGIEVIQTLVQRVEKLQEELQAIRQGL